MSEPYRADNLLDGLGDADTRQVHYDQEMRRERAILDRRLPIAGGEVLSVGCGRHPGRHLFPSPAFRMTGVDLDANMIESLRESGELDDGVVGRAGELPFEPRSFDVVLYRLVLHHVAYQRPLGPVFAEAARLLRPRGALVAVEPGLWQVSGRSELDFDDLVRLDFLYLERWSMMLDLAILLKTIPAVLSRRGAF